MVWGLWSSISQPEDVQWQTKTSYNGLMRIPKYRKTSHVLTLAHIVTTKQICQDHCKHMVIYGYIWLYRVIWWCSWSQCYTRGCRSKEAVACKSHWDSLHVQAPKNWLMQAKRYRVQTLNPPPIFLPPKCTHHAATQRCVCQRLLLWQGWRCDYLVEYSTVEVRGYFDSYT